MSFTPLGDALKGRMKVQKNLQSQVESAEVVDAAEKVFTALFGAELSAHIKPLFLKNRTLTVTCTSSTLAQEIRLNQTSIVQKINDALGRADVDRIRYLA